MISRRFRGVEPVLEFMAGISDDKLGMFTGVKRDGRA